MWVARLLAHSVDDRLALSVRVSALSVTHLHARALTYSLRCSRPPPSLPPSLHISFNVLHNSLLHSVALVLIHLSLPPSTSPSTCCTTHLHSHPLTHKHARRIARITRRYNSRPVHRVCVRARCPHGEPSAQRVSFSGYSQGHGNGRLVSGTLHSFLTLIYVRTRVSSAGHSQGCVCVSECV
jgi:hypothetical protein